MMKRLDYEEKHKYIKNVYMNKKIKCHFEKNVLSMWLDIQYRLL